MTSPPEAKIFSISCRSSPNNTSDDRVLRGWLACLRVPDSTSFSPAFVIFPGGAASAQPLTRPSELAAIGKRQ